MPARWTPLSAAGSTGCSSPRSTSSSSPYERTDEGAYLVELAGEHKLKTMTWLVVQDVSLLVEAFFMRKPAENEGGTYRFLLDRNARTYGVHFSVDRLGDIYLTGKLALQAVTPEEIDRVLGCVGSTPTATSTRRSSSASRVRSSANAPGGPSSRPKPGTSDPTRCRPRTHSPDPDRRRLACPRADASAAPPRRERVEQAEPLHRLGRRRPVRQGSRWRPVAVGGCSRSRECCRTCCTPRC